MKLKTFAAGFLMMLLLLVTSNAHAETFIAKGIVNSVDPRLTEFSLGEPFILRYTFDSDTPEFPISEGVSGFYAGAVKDISITVGDYQCGFSGSANLFIGGYGDGKLYYTMEVHNPLVGPAVPSVLPPGYLWVGEWELDSQIHMILMHDFEGRAAAIDIKSSPSQLMESYDLSRGNAYLRLDLRNDMFPGGPETASVYAYITEIYTDDEPVALPPSANAGLDQTVARHALVTLDGSGSADPQGEYPISYAWSLTTKPNSSTATLTGANTVNPSFTPDLAGQYVVTLVVTNSLGISSAPDTVVLSTVNSSPVADAGPDQSLLWIGESVQLDGSKSWDDDGDLLTFTWSFGSKPAGSAATLTAADTATPRFIADVLGGYTLLVTVRDPFGGIDTDSMTVSYENVSPVANAGTNGVVVIGTTISLDGSGSSDANRDSLSYAWSLAETPAGSGAVLESTGAAARFTADSYGDYRLSLIVSDGELTSDPSTVTISCLPQEGDAERLIAAAVDVVNAMDVQGFKNDKMRNTLTQKLSVIVKQVAEGKTYEAAQKLREDVLPKTDGCAEAGVADKNDWIYGCASQDDLVSLLEMILNSLEP